MKSPPLTSDSCTHELHHVPFQAHVSLCVPVCNTPQPLDTISWTGSSQSRPADSASNMAEPELKPNSEPSSRPEAKRLTGPVIAVCYDRKLRI